MLTCVQITGWIDEGLNEKAFIIPGLGDFGERRYVVNRSDALLLYLTIANLLLIHSGIAYKSCLRYSSTTMYITTDIYQICEPLVTYLPVCKVRELALLATKAFLQPRSTYAPVLALVPHSQPGRQFAPAPRSPLRPEIGII